LLSEWCGTLDELQLGYSPFVAMGEAKGVYKRSVFAFQRAMVAGVSFKFGWNQGL